MIKTLTFAAILALFSSCAIHSGTLTGSLPNTRVKESAIGEAKASYLLGIGGNSQQALVLQAKNELYSNFPLQANESYSNFTLDFKTSFYFIYWERKATITADIVVAEDGKERGKKREPYWVDFNEHGDYQVTIKPEEGKPSSLAQTTGVNIGDTVIVQYANTYKEGVVLDVFQSTTKVRISMKDQTWQTSQLANKKVFLTKSAISRNSKHFYGERIQMGAIPCTIVGSQRKYFLVVYKDGDHPVFETIRRMD